MRADHHVQQPQLQIQQQLTPRLHAHTACQQRYAHTQRLKIIKQRRIMLRRQNLRRRHQTALMTVLHRLRQGQHADNRLAAANVALQNAVHRLVAGHILRNLAPHLLLRLRQRKRQIFDNVVHQRSLRLMRNACTLILVLLAVIKQATLQKEQLLENKAVLRPAQRLPAFRKMNILQRLIARRQPALLNNGLRQAFRQLLRRQRQRLTHPLAQIILRQRSGQRINRHNARRSALALSKRLDIHLRHALRRAARTHAPCNLQLLVNLELASLIALAAKKVQRRIGRLIAHRHNSIRPCTRAIGVAHLAHPRTEKLLAAIRHQIFNCF